MLRPPAAAKPTHRLEEQRVTPVGDGRVQLTIAEGQVATAGVCSAEAMNQLAE
jgi:hypothetical protein